MTPQDGDIPVGLPKEDMAQKAFPSSVYTPWHRLIKEVQSCLADWPNDIDDLTIAAYLAGMVTDQERTKLEEAIQRFPAFHLMLHTAQEVLQDSSSD